VKQLFYSDTLKISAGCVVTVCAAELFTQYFQGDHYNKIDLLPSSFIQSLGYLQENINNEKG
jgi:hypothetical protein